MLGIKVAAISDCQKKTSPRIRSVGTPTESVRLDEVREEDPDPDALPETAGETRERVAGRKGEDERDHDHESAHENRVLEPAHVMRLVEDEADVTEGRGVAFGISLRGRELEGDV